MKDQRIQFLQSLEYFWQCPITNQIMSDPVVTFDGQTYERLAIQKWFKKTQTSPVTNLPLQSKQLIPNIIFRNMIQKFTNAPPSFIRKSQIVGKINKQTELLKKLEQKQDELIILKRVIQQLKKEVRQLRNFKKESVIKKQSKSTPKKDKLKQNQMYFQQSPKSDEALNQQGSYESNQNASLSQLIYLKDLPYGRIETKKEDNKEDKKDNKKNDKKAGNKEDNKSEKLIALNQQKPTIKTEWKPFFKVKQSPKKVILNYQDQYQLGIKNLKKQDVPLEKRYISIQFALESIDYQGRFPASQITMYLIVDNKQLPLLSKRYLDIGANILRQKQCSCQFVRLFDKNSSNYLKNQIKLVMIDLLQQNTNKEIIIKLSELKEGLNQINQIIYLNQGEYLAYFIINFHFKPASNQCIEQKTIQLSKEKLKFEILN